VRDMQLRGAALAALRQPHTTGEELMAIAAAHPDLMGRAATHKNAEAKLKDLANAGHTSSTSSPTPTSTTERLRETRRDIDPLPERPRVERPSRLRDTDEVRRPTPVRRTTEETRSTVPPRRPARLAPGKDIESALDEILQNWNDPAEYRVTRKDSTDELKESLDRIDAYLGNIETGKPAPRKRYSPPKVTTPVEDVDDLLTVSIDDLLDDDKDFNDVDDLRLPATTIDTDGDFDDWDDDEPSSPVKESLPKDSDLDEDDETARDENDGDKKDKPTKPVKKSKKATGKKKSKTPLLIGLVAVFLALVLALVFLVLLPYQARADFDTASNHYTTAQQEMRTAIAQGDAILESTTEEDVDNPELLSSLDSVVTEAKDYLGIAPEMASTTKEIRAQTDTLNMRTEQVLSMTAKLGHATSAVSSNRAQIGLATMTEILNQARTLYEESEGLVDNDAVRPDLLEAINAAQQAMDSVDSSDHAAVLAMLETHKATLQAASDAVSEVKKSKCDNGTIVPAGVNSMVCGGMPSGASVPRAGNKVQFTMPSGDMGCTKDAFTNGTMICEIPDRNWNFPGGVSNDCYSSATCHIGISGDGVVGRSSQGTQPWASNQSNGVKAPVLEDGKVADFGSVACLSTQKGVVCWDVKSHHGFRASKAGVMSW